MALESDAIISDLLDRLGNAGNYVRRVLQTMYEVRRDQGDDITVRIGIVGNGHSPHYRIDRANGETIEAFDGSNGRRFTDYTDFHAEKWSVRAMTFEQVKSLRGQLKD